MWVFTAKYVVLLAKSILDVIYLVLLCIFVYVWLTCGSAVASLWHKSGKQELRTSGSPYMGQIKVGQKYFVN